MADHPARAALPPPGRPSAHVIPFRMKPSPVERTLIIEGHLAATTDCPVCGRSEVQHAGFSCRELDLIAERIAYGRLPRWRRLFRRAPEGWRR